MIPEFVSIPDLPFGILPPGIHWADFAEIQARFAATAHRAWLFHGLLAAAEALQLAGCHRLYLDGSFVTGKEHPSDFDGCWEPDGVDSRLLDPVLLDFKNGRAAQKQKYRGELFITTPAVPFLEFLQVEKLTGVPKGIVGVALRPMSSRA